MQFQNRREAGRALAKTLGQYRGQHALVLALPRGGVPVAAEVAAALDADLDILLVRKIGAPGQPELALGAVVDGGTPIIVRNEDVIRFTYTTEKEFNAICGQELQEIERRRKAFLGNRAPLNPEGRIVIVVDDGIATGATTRAALRAIRMRGPKRLVLAVPVGPRETIEATKADADEVVCLTDLEPYGAVGYFYADFSQLEDADVTAILEKFADGGG